MICYANNPIISIHSIAHLRWKAGKFSVSPRPYAALAIRISGSAKITSNSAEYFVNNRDILFLPQGTGYFADYTDTEIIAIHFITANQNDAIEIYSPRDWDNLHTLFQKALTTWDYQKPDRVPLAMATIYRILAALCKSTEENVFPPSLSRAIEYIHAHYTDSYLPICDICKAAQIGETTLRQLSWKFLKKTPVEYINTLRLEYARDLIAEGAPIEVAAYKSGFNDPKYFARVVKKHFGCTPRELKLYGK